MLDLTPSERRGVLVLLLLVALGASWDLTHLRAAAAPELGPEPGPSSGDAARDDAVADRSAAPRPSAAAPSGPIDLNRATASQLDALPGIGPVLAGRIVEQRARQGAFRSVDELLAVRGIGPRLFERLRPLVTCARAGRTAAAESLQFAR